jgi:TetR/AcrR family transcriptional regulator
MVKPNSLSKRSKPAGSKPAKRAAPDSGSTAPGDTETRILSAARREFIAKGQDGARMQVIANEAGVNKALLHYYYRSKENLYRKVLEVTLATVWGRVKAEFNSQLSRQTPAPQTQPAEGSASLAGLHGLGVETIVRTFVSTFVRTLAANPDFPLFVFREIAGGGATFPVVLQELMKNFKDIPVALIKALQEEAKAGLIKPVHPLHFILNMMGMTVTTFLAIPMLRRLGPAAGFKFELDDAYFDARIHSITDTLLNGIRIRK